VTRFALVPAFLILLPAAASPQELGDAAAKEREKKAKAAPSGKTAPAFSNDDLASEKEKKRKKEEAEARGEKPEPDAPPPDQSTDSETGRIAVDGRPRLADPDRGGRAARDEAASDGPASDDTASDDTASIDTEWRPRVEAARNRVQEMEGRVAGIQTRIDELRARISPMNQQQEQDVNRILAVQQEITNAEAEMDPARANLKSAREELAALEETARQAGVAPGVLRPPQ
jgi:hypothetical protein